MHQFMRKSFIVLVVLLNLLSVAGAQLRISTNKDTVDFTKAKLLFSRDAQVIVKNISPTTVDINDMTIVTKNSVPTEFQIIVPQPPNFHVDSGDTRTITLRFKPAVQGIRTAVLEIMTDDGTKEVELIGEGSTIQPDILLVPNFIDFGMLTPGEFKDTTILLIGGDQDSATIKNIGVANYDAAIYFEAYPLDPTVTYPFILHPGDTVKLNARFTAFNASGPRAGKATIGGDVSGSIFCDFRGAVGSPDMTFTPTILDLGVIPQGAAVDTFISIASIGEAAVKLQRIDRPNLPFSVSALPSFPYNVIAGDSLKIAVHFDASTPGAYEEAIGAYSKNNGTAQGLNRSALLKALVVPRVLAKISPQPFIVSCAIDSLYQRTLTIRDTGNFPVSISNIVSDNPDFTISGISIFPDTIAVGERRDIIISFKPSSGAVVKNGTSIINVLTDGRVIVADTIEIIVQQENANLAVMSITPTSIQPYSNSFGVVTTSDLARYNLNSLEMEMTIEPQDVAEIDTLNASVDNAIIPNGSLKITYDQTTKKYHALITSTTALPTSPVIPFLNLPIKYYVAKSAAAMLHITTHSPEKDGCLIFSDDSIMISSIGACGDQIARNFLNEAPLLFGLSITPNPSSGKRITVGFSNTESIILSMDVIDVNGKIVAHRNGEAFVKGNNGFVVESAELSSGSYSLHLKAETSDGHSQDRFGTIILTH